MTKVRVFEMVLQVLQVLLK